MSAVLIVGGGVAGAASAIHLARAGHAVTLIEKETVAHDKVCGEFLSGEAVGYLAALGIDLEALGAVPISRVCFAGNERRLPFAAFSLSRRVLDEALLAKATLAGATILRGRTVEGIYRDDTGWCVRLNSSLPQGEENSLTAHSVFLASGKHDVRGLKRAAGKQNDLVAFKMHWRLGLAQQRQLQGAVELFLFSGGYGGLEPVEDGKANLCFLLRRKILDRLGGWAEALSHIRQASPLLAARLSGAEALWEKPLAITAIPYGHVQRRSDDGLWRLGDQATVIPSFSGDGMAIALHSARLAAETYLAGGSAADYQERLAGDVTSQVALATGISRALVNPVGQFACKTASNIVPRLIGMTARATRIPQQALVI